MSLPKKFASWKGVPGERIQWHPSINNDKCIGCGMCVTSCGRNVFDYDWKNKKAVVARPLQCMVGCTSCEVWCIYEAIEFPDKKYVRDLIRREKILALAKNQLEESKS